MWVDSAPLKLHKLKLLQQLTVFPFPFESTEADEAAPLHVAQLAHCFTMAFVEPEQHTYTGFYIFWSESPCFPTFSEVAQYCQIWPKAFIRIASIKVPVNKKTYLPHKETEETGFSAIRCLDPKNLHFFRTSARDLKLCFHCYLKCRRQSCRCPAAPGTPECSCCILHWWQKSCTRSSPTTALQHEDKGKHTDTWLEVGLKNSRCHEGQSIDKSSVGKKTTKTKHLVMFRVWLWPLTELTWATIF